MANNYANRLCRVLVNADESTWLKSERCTDMETAIDYHDPFQYASNRGLCNVLSTLNYLCGYNDRDMADIDRVIDALRLPYALMGYTDAADAHGW